MHKPTDRRFAGTIALVLLAVGLCAQDGRDLTWRAGLRSEMAVGSWLWFKTASDIDRSRTRAFVFTGVEASLGIDRHEVGLGTTVGFFDKNEMYDYEDEVGITLEYPISDGRGIGLVGGHLSYGYQLVRVRRYRFVPRLDVGSFHIATTHPDAPNFGMRWSWALRLTQRIEWVKTFLDIGPVYRQWRIADGDPDVRADHFLHGAGISLTLGFHGP